MKNIDSLEIPAIYVNSGGAKSVHARVLISRADGAPNFSMRMFELGKDGHTYLHTHNYEHVIFVLEGEGSLFFEGETSRLSANSAVLVPANKLHQFRNAGEKPFRFLCSIPNGEDIEDKLK